MKRATRAAATALVAVPLLLAPSGPAAADDVRVSVSYDGVHWLDAEAGLDRPLFDTAIRWVPGDVRTSRFYVRNESTDAGLLDVDIVRSGLGGLVSSDAVTFSARAGDGPWTVAGDGENLSLIDGDRLASGRVVPVRIRARFHFAATALGHNASMVSMSDLDFRVRLSDDVAGDGRGTSGTSGTSGLLPDTGSDLEPGLVWLSLLLLGSGAYLVARRRHADDDLAVVRHG